MNGTYFLFLTIGAVICTGLFAWKLYLKKEKPALSLLALPLAALLGTMMSKMTYVLLKAGEQFDNYGLSAFLRTQPAEFSFAGGCAGVVLAVWLVARIAKRPAASLLDAFAPCGALMYAIARGCTYFLDPMCMVGIGDYVENEALCFFPVAVENQMFGGWFFAVFMLECACALVCALAAFLLSRKACRPGRVLLHTVFFLALPQVFCEQLLGSYMKWGFVRVEQLLCAMIAFGIILYACIKNKGASKRFLPAILSVLCMLMVIDLLFMLDNKYLFGLELAPNVCYILMIGLLGCMAALSLWAYRRLNKHKEA